MEERRTCKWCASGGWQRQTCDWCGTGSEVEVIVAMALHDTSDYPYSVTTYCLECWGKHGIEAADTMTKEACEELE